MRAQTVNSGVAEYPQERKGTIYIPLGAVGWHAVDKTSGTAKQTRGISLILT